MPTLLPVIRYALLLGCLLVVFLLSTSQAEDEDKPRAAQNEEGVFDIDPSNFDQWVYGGSFTAEQAKQRLQSQLTLIIEEIDRVCSITDAQKKKLQLAGRGDLKRFYDDVEVVRKEFLAVRRDQEKFNQLWQKISPLQLRVASGLFSHESLFKKTVQQTLAVEQYAAYETADRERRKARYFARVDQYIAMLESGLPLKDEQRKSLRALLQEEGKIPDRIGQYDVYLVQYRLSKIPEKTLQPIFDPEQWKVLQQQLVQGRGMEQFLRTQKVLGAGE